MKSKIILLLILTPFILFGITTKTTQSGNWNNSSTWTNSSPNSSDTVIVSENDTLYVNSSNAICAHLELNGTLFFRSATNQLTTLTAENNKTAEITGTSLGNLFATKLIINGLLQVDKVKLHISDSLINYGTIKFTSTSGTKTFNHLLNLGIINNSIEERITINKGLINLSDNSSTFGSIEFTDSATLETTSLLSINNLEIKTHLTVLDSLKVLNSLTGTGTIENQGYLNYCGQNNKLTIDKLDLINTNTFHLSGAHQYKVPNITNNTFYNLWVSNGKLITTQPTIGINQFKLFKNGTISVRADYTFPKFKKYKFDSSSTFSLSENIKDSLAQNLNIHHLDLKDDAELDLSKIDTLFISGNTSGTGELKNSKVIKYNGSSSQTLKKMDYSTLIFNNPQLSTIKGKHSISNLIIQAGFLEAEGLIIKNLKIDKKATLIYSGSTVSTTESTLINGILRIKKQNDHYFYDVQIGDSGLFDNQSNSNIIIQENLTNNGALNSCLGNNCKFTFLKSNANIQGKNKISIPKLIGHNIQNQAHIVVQTNIQIDTFYAQPNSVLELAMDSSNYSGNFELTQNSNKVIFSRNSKQFIGNSFTAFSSIEIKNRGEKIISNDLKIQDSLVVAENSVLKSDTFNLIFDDSAHFILNDSSTFSLGHNYNLKDIHLATNLTRKNFHFCSTSTFKYMSKGDKTISTVPIYGNLSIDDGSIAQSTVTLINDSLFIAGDFNLEESSIHFELDEKFIRVNKNWNGPGNCFMNKSTFELLGDGNASGKLTSINSEFHYTGKKKQRVKVGQYNSLIINKTNDAYSKANIGTLYIDSLFVQKGTFNFAGEKSIVNYIEVTDTVLFSSRFQEKEFNTIYVKPTGVFNLNFNRSITITKDLICHGKFSNPKGEVQFVDSLPQVISGNGSFEFGKVKINKPINHLIIRSNIQLRDTLTLDSGNFQLQNASLELTHNSFIQNENISSRIQGDKNSEIFTRIMIGSNDTSEVRGIGIEIHSTLPLGITTIQRKFNSIDILGEPSISSNYSIHPQNNQNLNATLFYPYRIHELGDHSENNLSLWKTEDNINWTKIESDLKNQKLIAKNIYSFSKWTIHQKELKLLAVKTISSQAKRKDEYIQLNWQTTPLNKKNWFEVLSKSGDEQFKNLGNVQPNETNKYSFYFKDRSQKPVQVKVIERSVSTHDIAFTKTVQPFLEKKIRITNKKGCIEILNFENGVAKLYDLSGRLIQTQKAPIRFLATKNAGIHFIEVQNEKIHETYKILLR